MRSAPDYCQQDRAARQHSGPLPQRHRARLSLFRRNSRLLRHGFAMSESLLFRLFPSLLLAFFCPLQAKLFGSLFAFSPCLLTGRFLYLKTSPFFLLAFPLLLPPL